MLCLSGLLLRLRGCNRLDLFGFLIAFEEKVSGFR